MPEFSESLAGHVVLVKRIKLLWSRKEEKKGNMCRNEFKIIRAIRSLWRKSSAFQRWFVALNTVFIQKVNLDLECYIRNVCTVKVVFLARPKHTLPEALWNPRLSIWRKLMSFVLSLPSEGHSELCPAPHPKKVTHRTNKQTCM